MSGTAMLSRRHFTLTSLTAPLAAWQAPTLELDRSPFYERPEGRTVENSAELTVSYLKPDQPAYCFYLSSGEIAFFLNSLSQRIVATSGPLQNLPKDERYVQKLLWSKYPEAKLKEGIPVAELDAESAATLSAFIRLAYNRRAYAESQAWLGFRELIATDRGALGYNTTLIKGLDILGVYLGSDPKTRTFYPLSHTHRIRFTQKRYPQSEAPSHAPDPSAPQPRSSALLKAYQQSMTLETLFTRLYGADAQRILLDDNLKTRRVTLLKQQSPDFELAGRLCAHISRAKWTRESQAPKPPRLKITLNHASLPLLQTAPMEVLEKLLPPELTTVVKALINKLEEPALFGSELAQGALTRLLTKDFERHKNTLLSVVRAYLSQERPDFYRASAAPEASLPLKSLPDSLKELILCSFFCDAAPPILDEVLMDYRSLIPKNNLSLSLVRRTRVNPETQATSHSEVLTLVHRNKGQSSNLLINHTPL